MSVFDQMVFDLSIETFKDYGAIKVSKEDYNSFMKEFVFEKLKGKKLGEAFAQKFHIRDRVLYMYNKDCDAIAHIQNCKYVQ